VGQVLSRVGYLLVLACFAAVLLPGAGAADLNSPNVRLDWTFPEGPSRTHSDLAMWGDIVVAGNYDGFRVFDVSRSGTERLRANKLCRGPQNDVSLWEHEDRLLLFLSNDTPQINGETVCSTNRASDTTACGTTCFEGIRIFDLSDPANPVLIKGVYTDCGSHTHTQVPDLANNRMLLYISSYPGGTGPRCQSPFRKFSIVEVPLDAPETASVLSQHPLTTNVPGCHDMTAFLAIDKMAASCATEGQLWDISDPANPATMTPVHIDLAGVNYWHSASFTWDGQYVVFMDESFTGTCQANGDGKIHFYRVSDGVRMSSFMIPRPQGGTYCSVHNGNIIPVAGRYLLVAGWYGGGTSIVDFTNPAAPVEVGYYVATTGRGRSDAWSSYWYNGKIYTNDIVRGLDVFKTIVPGVPYGETLTHLNAQTQEQFLTPPLSTLTPLGRLASGL
jgi:LVIVD repeat